MNTDQIKKIVGSLLIVGFDGTELSASCRNFLVQWDLGGVILFKRNVESLEQVSALNQSIYDNARVTPIVSVDHEGGRVFRLPEPFTQFPPMAQLGKLAPSREGMELASQVGTAFGSELSAAGFNLDYAPVLDVNSNRENPVIGDRAFSEDPELAGQSALAFLSGLQSTGVLGCGKHFPGHGDTTEDSHHTLPVVDKSKKELMACELKPFQMAVGHHIPMIMTAHVLYPSLDPEWPATLSEKILFDLLRTEMGFQGLLVSDDMFMKGMTEKWSLEEAGERFFRAGGDLLLLCHQESAQRRVAAHLVHLAEKDRDFLENLEGKAQRVERFRKNLNSGIRPQLLEDCQARHEKLLQSLV